MSESGFYVHLIDRIDEHGNKIYEKGKIERLSEKHAKQQLKNGCIRSATPDEITNELKHAAMEEELQLFDFIEKPRQYLDIGLEQDHLYFGKLTPGEGGMRETLVLDDKSVFRNNRHKVNAGDYTEWEGENQVRNWLGEYESHIGDIMPRWTNESIRKYLLGETVDKKKIYTRMYSKINEHMDYSFNPSLEGVIQTQICWITATYMYPVFDWFPHLLFYGPRESGKSKNATLIMYMSFGGYQVGASGGVTPPTLYNTLQGNRGTLFFDEYEKIEKSETQLILNQLLNAACDRESYIIKNVRVKGSNWVPKKFPIFSPKIAANISGINATSLTRYIPIQLLKTLTSKGKKKPRKDKLVFNEIRDHLHILALQNWKEIREIYETVDFGDLINRDADNWKPILSVAKWYGPKAEEGVLRYIQNSKDVEVDTGDVEADFLYILLDKVGDEPSYYAPKDIGEWCEDILGFTKSPACWVGRRLKKFGFKPTRVGKGQRYLLSKGTVSNIINRYYPMTDKGTQDTQHTLDT